MARIQREAELERRVAESVAGLLKMPISPDLLNEIRDRVQAVLQDMGLDHVTFTVRSEDGDVFIERIEESAKGRKTMTEDEFKKITGHAPENDDMDRVNCTGVGEPGHLACGTCPQCGKPAWVCEHFPETTSARMQASRNRA